MPGNAEKILTGIERLEDLARRIETVLAGTLFEGSAEHLTHEAAQALTKAQNNPAHLTAGVHALITALRGGMRPKATPPESGQPGIQAQL
jgi:hypothetical protein